MSDFENQGGIAFLLIYFTARDEFYYMPMKDLRRFWNRAAQGGRRSVRFEEFDHSYRIPKGKNVLLPYLDMIQKDLESREQEQL